MLPSKVEVLDKTEHTTAKGGTMTTVDLKVTWTLTDGITGETATIESFGAGADTGDKYSGKATTSAMKYALLAGFLLSTGEDTERSDASDRQPRTHTGHRDGNPGAVSDRPQLDRPVNDLIGTVEVGKPPVDMNPRTDKDLGPVWGFKLKNGSKGFQVLAMGDLAAALSSVGLEVGTRVTVEGSMVMVPWKKAGEDMPPFSRVMLSRLHTPDWTLPADVPASTTAITPDEAEEILRLELAEAS
jgi:hypothetical protein